MTVACVLRSGGDYHPEHVQALAAGVEAHLPGARFVCLSDVPVPGVRTVPLAHDWPGWWSKMELWRPGALFGRVLYVDLDSVAVGDLSDLAAYAGEFCIVRDFYRPERPQSCVMAWDADSAIARRIWDAFTADPAGHMAEHRSGGDQSFLRTVIGDDTDKFQTLYPGQVVSWKVDCADGAPEGARIVCAHGKPKPWDREWAL